MTPVRPIAALLLAGLLALVSADGADAAVLLPELDSIFDADSADDTTAVESASSLPASESERPLPPNPQLAFVTPCLVGSTTMSTSVSLSTIVVTGGLALQNLDCEPVGGSLQMQLPREPRHGWTLLIRTGVFRPPRIAA